MTPYFPSMSATRWPQLVSDSGTHSPSTTRPWVEAAVPEPAASGSSGFGVASGSVTGSTAFGMVQYAPSSLWSLAGSVGSVGSVGSTGSDVGSVDAWSSAAGS